MAIYSDSIVPKYRVLTDQLRRQIEAGELRPGDRLPPSAQLRAQYGVSLGTAEKAFAELEKNGLIVRVQGSGTFVAARRKSTGLIGFLGQTLANRHRTLPESYMADAMEQAAAKAGKSIVQLSYHSASGWNQIEGVIVVASCDHGVWLRENHPLVPAVHLLAGSRVIASIVADEVGGARSAVQHLLALGHRRIACLFQNYKAEEPSQSTARFAGYLSGLRDFGIEPLAEWTYNLDAPTSSEAGYRAWGYSCMKQWLEDGWLQAKCTALVTQNDLAAIGAIDALLEAGLRVPDDVSVVGFDSTEVCDCVSPRVSAVRIPLGEMARLGVETLVQQIEEGHSTPENQTPSLTVITTCMEPRESTGPCMVPTDSRNSDAASQIKKMPSNVIVDRLRLLDLIEGIPAV